MTRKILLSRSGKGRPSKIAGEVFALVDDEDYKWLNKMNWSAVMIQRRNGGYASRNEMGKNIFMHRLIMEAPEGMQVDHINGNGLDNRRSNLRLVTSKLNHANRSRNSTKHGYKGVFKEDGQWKMQIAARFKDEEDAARAFDKCAIALHGEHARLNFVEPERDYSI